MSRVIFVTKKHSLAELTLHWARLFHLKICAVIFGRVFIDVNFQVGTVLKRTAANVALERLVIQMLCFQVMFQDGHSGKVLATLFTLERFEFLMYLEKQNSKIVVNHHKSGLSKMS